MYENFSYCQLQNEAERKLEVEMQKRRERIEKWRLERKKGEVTASDEVTSKLDEEQQQEKKWTLDNEEEDEESAPQETGK